MRWDSMSTEVHDFWPEDSECSKFKPLESDGDRFSVYCMVFLGYHMTSHAEKVLAVTQ